MSFGGSPSPVRIPPAEDPAVAEAKARAEREAASNDALRAAAKRRGRQSTLLASIGSTGSGIGGKSLLGG